MELHVRTALAGDMIHAEVHFKAGTTKSEAAELTAAALRVLLNYSDEEGITEMMKEALRHQTKTKALVTGKGAA